MDFDAFIIFGYLIGTLIYGLYVGRGVRNINDYALGGRNFTTPVLAATIFATYASSSGFYVDLTRAYEDGLLKLGAKLFSPISMIFTAFYIAPRIKEFFGKLSVAEMIGDIYGTKSRIISSIPIFLVSVGMLAVQIKVLSTILSHFGEISNEYAVIITSLIIVLYSAFGGIRAVTFTDFFQFLTFGIAVPILFIKVVLSININFFNDTSAIMDRLINFTPEKIQLYTVMSIYFLMPNLNSSLVQRMLMAKNVKQMRDSTFIAAIFYVIIIVMSSIIGILFKVQNPLVESENILPTLIDNYAFVGLKGILIIGIIAMAMSTADSYLNTGAVSFSHDFLNLMFKIDDKNQLAISKLFTLISGFIGMYIAFFYKDVVAIILSVYGFYLPIVSVPLLLALFGFRSSERAVLTGMAFGCITLFFWDNLMNMLSVENPVSSFIPAMLAHLIGLFGVHYIFGEKGGWGQGPGEGPFNSPSKDFWNENLTSNELDGFSNNNKANLSKNSSLKSIFNYILRDIKSNVPQAEYFYNRLSIYLFITYSFLAITIAILEKHFMGSFFNNLLISLPLICAFLLLMRNLVKDRESNILSLIFIFSSVISLPYISVYFLVRYSNYEIISLITILQPLAIISILSMPILMSWGYAVLGNLIGISAAFLTNYIQGDLLIFGVGIKVFLFSVMLPFLFTILISRGSWRYIRMVIHSNELLRTDKDALYVRLKGSEENINRLYNLRSELLNNFSHEVRTPLTSTGNYIEIAVDKFKSDKQNFSHIELIKANFDRLKNYILRLSDLSSYQKTNMLYDMKDENLLYILENIAYTYIEKVKINLNIPDEYKGLSLKLDALKLKEAFDEIISNSIIHANSNEINIDLVSDDEGIISLIFTDIYNNDADNKQNHPLENKDLEEIFEVFNIEGNGSRGYRGLGLAFVKEVMRIHKGRVSARIYEDEINNFGLQIKLDFSLTNNDLNTTSTIATNKETITSDNKKLKILVVDDDETILNSASLILESMGHEVYLAAGGEDAINFIQAEKEKIHVMLLDIMMPDKSGVEVLESVWERLKNSNVKTIIQSGAGIIDEYQREFSKYPGIKFCSKPYTKKQLEEAIVK